MSLSQPPTLLRRWLCTRSLQTARLTLPYNTTRHQPFHSSSATHAVARSPAAQRASRQHMRASPSLTNDGLVLNMHIRGGAEERDNTLRRFELEGPHFWASALRVGVFPPAVTLNVFMRFGRQLFEQAFIQAPNELSVRRISRDVELVYRVGYAISRFYPPVNNWLLSACARAGSKTAILIAANDFLHKPHTVHDTRVKILADVKRFAVEDRDPYAIVLHAWVLSQLKEYKESLALLRPVMDSMYPTRDTQALDPILSTAIPKPWAVYTFSLNELGRDKDVNEVQRMAATDYHDPEALMVHAYNLLRSKQDPDRKQDASMKSKDDFSEYEQLMCLAATSGNGDACRRLGNFYFLKYLHLKPITLDYVDDHPQPDANRIAAAEERMRTEKASNTWNPRGNPKTLLEYLRYHLHLDRSRDDYYMLAMEWYLMAVNHGDHLAALLLARQVYQRQNQEYAFSLLDKAEEGDTIRSRARALRIAWLKGNNPNIRDSYLDI